MSVRGAASGVRTRMASRSGTVSRTNAPVTRGGDVGGTTWVAPVRYRRPSPSGGVSVDVKKLSRGDAVIGVAALLIFIFSFMDYIGAKDVPRGYTGDTGWSAWSGHLAPTAFAVVLTPIIAGVLFILGGALPQLMDRQILGLTAR